MKKLYAKKSSSHLSISKKYFFSTKIFILLFAFLGMASVGAGQTVIHSNTCASATSGWTYTNGTTTQVIQQSGGGGYWLLEDADVIISQSFDVHTYTGGLTLDFDVAAYGNGTPDKGIKVEYSTNGGTNWSTTTFTSAKPNSSTFISSGTFTISATTSTTFKLRFTKESIGGKQGVRLKNISFKGTISPTCTNASITSHPSTFTQSLCVNSNATALSVTASGSPLTYQWYKNTISSNSGGTLIAGATNNSYTPPTTVAGTTYFYCVVSATGCTGATSNVSGAIIVNALPSNPTGTISGTDYCGTTNLRFSNPQTINYWQTAANGTSTSNKVTSSDLSVNTNANYYVRAYNGTCWSTNSVGPYTVTIKTPASITTQPSAQSVISGATATFTVAATNAGSYQWQVSTNGGTSWANISGATSASYTTAATTLGMNNYQYRCLVTSAAPCADVITSNAVTLTVIDGPCLSEGFDGYNGSVSGWTFTGIGSSQTYTSATNYGNSSPSLKMDASGDRILTPTVTNAASLSFWIKGQGTDENAALLVEGYNGTSWVTIENLKPLPITGTTITYNATSSPALPANLIQFRFTYTKSGGNLAFDDVEVYCVTAAPIMQVQGNSTDISSGDVSPSTSDNTDFGTTFINTNITKTFTIKNTGNADLILDAGTPVVLLDGTQGFSVTQPALTTIPANGSTDFTVTFNKSTLGIFEETVMIGSNDAASGGVYDFAITAETVCSSPSEITSFTPTTGPIGTRIYMKGSGYTGATSVSLSGLPATSFSITGDTLIVTQIAGNSGKLELTDVNGCMTKSSSSFTLIDKSGECSANTGIGTPTDLVISEVYDATKGALGYVQLFNGTASSISLASYKIRVNTGTQTDFALTGTVASGGIFVLRLGDDDIRSESPGCGNIFNQTASGGGFNGDDTISLVKNGSVIDFVTNPYTERTPGFSQKRKFATNLTRPSISYNASDWEISDDENCTTLNVVPYDINGKTLIINTQPTDNLDCIPNINVAGTSSIPGGINFTWYYNDPKSMSGWSVASGLTGATGSTSNSYSIGASALPDYYGYQFYASVNSGGSGTTCTKPSIAVQYKFPTAPYYQTKSGGAWNDATMWEMSDNGISSFTNACKYPISLTSDNVLIQNDITLPINLEVKQLNISANKTLSNSADVILTVTGNLTVNGTLNLKEDKVGTLVLSGKTDQTISGTGTDSINVWNVQLSNTNNAKVITNKELNVFGKMSFDTPSKLALGSGDVSLKSTANNTANLGPIVSSDAITYSGSGRFIVERYISSKAWHFLSVPTTGSTFKSAWQEGNDPGSGLESSKNNKPGYGTILTSPLGVSAGFDTISPQPSVKYFNNDSARYYPLSKTDSLMNFRGGYMVFIRGDRSVNPNYGNATTTTLRTRGELYTMVTQPTDSIFVGADSFALIGNPYPSAIDFSEIKVYGASNPVLETYYIWDPNLTSGEGATQYGLGAFRTISGSYSVPSSGNYQDGSIPFIQSGQAFFVYNDSETDSIKIVIPETVKVDGSTQTYKTGSHHSNASSTINDASLRSNLYRILNGQPPVLLDGTLTLFGASFNNEVNGSDASKLKNVNTENMSMRRNGKVLAIERRQLPEEADTIFYKMNNYRIAPYRFAFIANKLDVSGKDAFLYDKYLQTFTAVSPNDTTWYDFTITSATGSWDENRFSIVFKNSKTTPVTLTNLKAYTKNKDIVVEWSVENESNMRSYTIETSTDGKTFIKGGTVAAKNVLATTYQWLDVNVNPGYHYYRILSTELDGKTNYSKIVRVLVGNNSGNGKITIYPNPIKDGVINLQFENQEAGVYQLRLLNSVGQVMINKTINHPGGSSSELLILNSTITKGVYHLEIYKGSERVMSEKVVY